MTVKELKKIIGEMPDDCVVCAPTLDDSSRIVLHIEAIRGTGVFYENAQGHVLCVFENPSYSDRQYFARNGYKKMKKENIIIIQ